MYSRILVGVDEGAADERAVDHAAGLARQLSAALRIVHVMDLGWLPVEAELGRHVLKIADARRAAATKVLAAARERARGDGVEAETSLREVSAPRERVDAAICDEAGEWGAKLVVLGTHGRRGFERLVLGSVAEGVARRSAVPVVLVPPAEGGA